MNVADINLIRNTHDDDDPELTITANRDKWIKYTPNFLPYHNFLYECHESILGEYLGKWFKDSERSDTQYRILECTQESAWMNYGEYFQLFKISQYRDSKGWHVNIRLDSIDDGGWGAQSVFKDSKQADCFAQKIMRHFEQNHPYNYEIWFEFCWLWGIEIHS